MRAFEGVDGYKAALTHSTNAVIVDLEMPEGQGDFVFRRLKRHPMTARLPVIVLTEQTDESLHNRLLEGGADAVLTKPVDFDQLWSHLASHISLLPINQSVPALPAEISSLVDDPRR